MRNPKTWFFILCTIALSVLYGIGACAAEPLEGTRWQLVQIMEMDDSTHVPKQRGDYTLAFQADGTVQLRADCNRATGSWQSAGPGQLQFGALAGTRAMCPPGSLHDVYLAQFPWVRSYVLKEGNLFLATMADGSIIEFEPASAGPVTARVLGENLYSQDAEEIQQQVLEPLFDRYMKAQGIQAEPAEIDAYLADMDRTLKARLGEDYEGLDSLSAEEAAEVRAMRGEMARTMIERWKMHQALYRQYGGRIIFQQFGPEPLDAYRQYLEERQQAGDFEILDEAIATQFWHYFRDEGMHSFYEPGSEAEQQAFTRPPWEKSGP